LLGLAAPLAMGGVLASMSKPAHATGPTQSIFNVLDYTGGDTAAIQAALNAAANNGVCLIPERGTPYVITSAINVPTNSYVILMGTIQLGANANTLMLSLGSRVTICGTGTIDGNRSNQHPTPSQGLAGIYAYNVSNIYISGITVTNCYHWPVNIVGTSHATLENCSFGNSGNSTEFAGGSSQCWAVGCTFTGGADELFCFYGAVTDSGISRCILNGGTTGAGISILNNAGNTGASQRISICHNICGGNWLSGIAIATGSGATLQHQDISICGNILHGNCQFPSGYSTLAENNAAGVVISGNQIFNDGNGTASNGILIDSNCTRVTISGNDIRNEGQGTAGTGQGVVVTNGASKILINGNQIYDNQATKTMAYAIGGSATSGVVVLNNLLGPTIGYPIAIPTGSNVFANNTLY
jgi:hypothetical protein